jgi:hypothetical protein
MLRSRTMLFLRLILGFAPWLAFLIIAHGSLWRLKLALVVALALSIVMAVTRLHRGIIMWVGLIFFSVAALLVVGMNTLWAVRLMGVLASGVLAISTWVSLLIRRPFTLDYARQHVDPALWNDPRFLRINRHLTTAWGIAFTINALLAYGKMQRLGMSPLAYELLSYACLIGTALFTSWYPGHVRRRARAQA